LWSILFYLTKTGPRRPTAARTTDCTSSGPKPLGPDAAGWLTPRVVGGRLDVHGCLLKRRAIELRHGQAAQARVDPIVLCDASLGVRS